MRQAVACVFAERVAAGMRREHFVDRVRRARGRQQVGLPANDDSAECDEERVAVLAEIDGLARGRQRRGDGFDVGEKLGDGNGATIAPGQRPRGIRDTQERQRGGCTFDDSRHVFPSPSQWDP